MILHPGNEYSLLLPAAPPFARRRGWRCWWANTRAAWHGRRDRNQPVDSEGLTSFTCALHYHADQVASLIDDALQAALDPVDQRLAELDEALKASVPHDQNNETPSDPDERPAPTEDGSLASDEARRTARLRQAAAQEARSRREQEHRQAQAEFGRLTSHRVDLLRAARDIADSYSARCDELVQHHRRGYSAVVSSPHGATGSQTRPKRHIANYDWANPSARALQAFPGRLRPVE